MLKTALAIGLECLSSIIVVVSHMCGFVEVCVSVRGVAKILGKGVRARKKCKPHPLINCQVRSQRERMECVMPM